MSSGGGRLAPVAAWAAAVALLAGACGTAGQSSARVGRSGAEAAPVEQVNSSTTSSKVSGLVPTVPDCGAGAYRPLTLLIVCAEGGTMATGVVWSWWGQSDATGRGLVHLQMNGEQVLAPADLRLDEVSRTGREGPHFTRLTVTWLGTSPDGHPNDQFRLGAGG